MCPKESFHITLKPLKINSSIKSIHVNKISRIFLIFNKIFFVVQKGGRFHIKLIKIMVLNTIERFFVKFSSIPLSNKIYSSFTMKISFAMHKGQCFLIKLTKEKIQISSSAYLFHSIMLL